MLHVGLDVHKKDCTIGILDTETGEIRVEKALTNRVAIQRAAKGWDGEVRVSMEACLHSPAVCRWLEEVGVDAHLADPQSLHEVGKLPAAKTDRIDAIRMARLSAFGMLPECYKAPGEVVDLRSLSRGRDTLVKAGTRLRNQLRSFLTQNGIVCKAKDLLSQQALKQRERWLAEMGPLTGCVAGILWGALEFLQSQITLFEKEMERIAQENPVAQELMKLPGIKKVVALGLMAEIGDVGRFEGVKPLFSYAGVIPRVYQSGEKRATGPLPRRCNKRLRYWAILAAQGAARRRAPNAAKKTYQRVKANHGSNTAKVAAAREILTMVFHCWRQAGDGVRV